MLDSLQFPNGSETLEETPKGGRNVTAGDETAGRDRHPLTNQHPTERLMKKNRKRRQRATYDPHRQHFNGAVSIRSDGATVVRRVGEVVGRLPAVAYEMIFGCIPQHLRGVKFRWLKP